MNAFPFLIVLLILLAYLDFAIWYLSEMHNIWSKKQIESIPAADVRPVVLCKDCKMQQYCKVAQYLGKDGFCSKGEKDVRSLGKCKLYKDCEYRTIWNCCCEDCNMMEES